ncbi:MAG TPA: hypothetical protein GXX41_13695 [Thermoanaerobacterium sp.]|nr:hypothetical protein [Thermoanaerobacterium sp.]
MAFSPCPRCGGATELRSSRYGPFFGCASYRGGNCDGLVNVPRRVLELAVQDLGLTCPRCGGNIVLKSGRNGLFLSFSQYPDCRWTDSFRPLPASRGLRKSKIETRFPVESQDRRIARRRLQILGLRIGSYSLSS